MKCLPFFERMPGASISRSRRGTQVFEEPSPLQFCSICRGIDPPSKLPFTLGRHQVIKGQPRDELRVCVHKVVAGSRAQTGLSQFDYSDLIRSIRSRVDLAGAIESSLFSNCAKRSKWRIAATRWPDR